jgi:hypothetical protein
MIVRASGPGLGIICKFCPGCSPPPAAKVDDASFVGMRLPVWAYSVRGRASYTGDELLELHIPGNPLLARMLLDE